MTGGSSRSGCAAGCGGDRKPAGRSGTREKDSKTGASGSRGSSSGKTGSGSTSRKTGQSSTRSSSKGRGRPAGRAKKEKDTGSQAALFLAVAALVIGLLMRAAGMGLWIF